MNDARDAPALDWRALMRAGLCHLRLPPTVFWALTPAELRLMLGQDSGDRPLARDGLQALMRAFPDAAHTDDDPDRDTTPRKEPETWPTAT